MWVRSLTGGLVNLGQCSLVAMIPNETDAHGQKVVAFESIREDRTAVLFVGTAAQCLSFLDDLFVEMANPPVTDEALAPEVIATALDNLTQAQALNRIATALEKLAGAVNYAGVLQVSTE